jgi:hypothetical protein
LYWNSNNQHEFENVSQLVLRKIADKDNFSICPTGTRGMWQVASAGRYLRHYDLQGNDLHNETRGGWSGKCPLNSNELKPCIQLLNKLGPDSTMTVASGTLHFVRSLRPTKETEIGGCTVRIDIDGKGSLQARLDGIVPH